jgi:hypothetical protein
MHDPCATEGTRFRPARWPLTIGQVPNVTGYRCEPIELAGELYMRRWFPGPGLSARVHEILASDPHRDLHDHPWDFTSTILFGSYRDITPEGERTFGPGDVIERRATDLHRLVVLDGPVWTMVRTGPFRRRWGFATASGWVHWREYEKAGHERSREWL